MASSSDNAFYDQRAADVQAAITNGDIDGAAHLVAHAVIEEGAAAFEHLTNAAERNKRKS